MEIPELLSDKEEDRSLREGTRKVLRSVREWGRENGIDSNVVRDYEREAVKRLLCPSYRTIGRLIDAPGLYFSDDDVSLNISVNHGGIWHDLISYKGDLRVDGDLSSAHIFL